MTLTARYQPAEKAAALSCKLSMNHDDEDHDMCHESMTINAIYICPPLVSPTGTANRNRQPHAHALVHLHVQLYRRVRLVRSRGDLSEYIHTQLNTVQYTDQTKVKALVGSRNSSKVGRTLIRDTHSQSVSTVVCAQRAWKLEALRP